MKRTLKLFVYGTLQPHAGTRMAGWVASRQVWAEPASAPGRLQGVRGATGWFPALVPGKGAARVQGTLCVLRLTAGELALLDRYEGREYRRFALSVRTATGRRAVAQTYRWRVPLSTKSPTIARGDFLGWLRASRRRVFSN
ncbi:hypothetical protein WSK_1677 [Novosphingobium sp. Rr 2-17]|uniref:gamma-glutamylcyclotransferase family protein n=1 Tax=Novosphingobium sp. Rr 2-17 TaxID=555793 RepID=UPI000269A1BC|nr:gamma-glutamylcyclotransferase family protein [Novosphingobium sp. Rr 2-17]EIZ79700.1 hypothetical protein WSK_1677 [Novosphingobium sp. Rr 2-17]